jgi:hypothetical protein
VRGGGFLCQLNDCWFLRKALFHRVGISIEYVHLEQIIHMLVCVGRVEIQS